MIDGRKQLDDFDESRLSSNETKDDRDISKRNLIEIKYSFDLKFS